MKLTNLKELKKKIKTDHNLALELYMTGNSDAMYLAGLIEDPKEVAEKIGRIEPIIAKNSCNTQTATEYLKKYVEKGKIGVKIKNLRC